MNTADFDYNLPAELIAQEPPPSREDARMMVVRRDTRTWEHRRVGELPEFLRAGDLLVLNDTRVIPARIFGRKESGG
ncbi:MAG: S-adenosylmethionine:tRNA ribosyltransferase-isomerase, partial [Kiritimatiellae bacterium]|nr:S-adenosylmethionine:tRNA ribosyltransferase-isomerase [Kiritimatiellia bacterium]